MEFYKRHVCRVGPFPDCVQRTFADLAEHPDVYMHMQGPNEFVITGTLKDWDITARLPEIEVPTLITAGATTSSHRGRRRSSTRASAGSELVTFEDSSHMQYVEEPERYLEVVAASSTARGRVGFAPRGPRLPDAARPGRQHAGRPAPEDRGRARPDPARQARVPEPGRLEQGPDRALDDRRGGAHGKLRPAGRSSSRPPATPASASRSRRRSRATR